MGDADPGAGAADHDHISDLPDHLLHDILIRLPGTADAARTSVLSRRWRRVWAQTPVISLVYWGEFQPESRVLDRVDAALAAHAAGTGTSTVSLSRLEITLSLPYNTARQLRSDGVAAWLLVAAQRLAGELQIRLPIYFPLAKDDGGEVLLPLCERATSISLDLNDRTLRFALPPAAAAGGVSKFAALATLTIRSAHLRGRELEAALSTSRCPCLKKLVIQFIKLRQDDGDDDDLSIRSDSLEWLKISSVFRLGGGRLRLCVDAPNLQMFHGGITCDLCVVAPKLSEVRWQCGGAYGSSQHHLACADHQLRRLEVEADPFGFALMRQFNTIDELELTVNIKRGVEEYERFLKGTDTSVNCKVLLLKFMNIEHGFQPAMLHLLRQCASVRRLVVQLNLDRDGYLYYPCKVSSGCPCSQLESNRTKNVVLDSLEEVVITDHGQCDHKVELVRLLRRCSTRFQRKVSITVWQRGQIDVFRNKIEDHHNKILNICPRNNKTEIIVRQSGSNQAVVL